MMPKNNYVALIPLRGGSKGIPGKNIKSIAGKPLFYWVIAELIKSQYISQVYVSTDCDKISRVVQSFFSSVKVVKRPEEFATDEASTESVMMHFCGLVDFVNLITVQATSPLTKVEDFDAAIDKFESVQADSMLSVVRSHQFFWTLEGQPINYSPTKRPRRQDWDGVFVENGAFYITARDTLLAHECRLAGQITTFELSPEQAVDIDNLEDWCRAEQQLLKITSNEE